MSTDRDQRAFYRIKTWIPARCRRAEPADIVAVEQRVARGEDSRYANPAQAPPEWAIELDLKLHRILSLLEPDRPMPLSESDAVSVVLSGAGLELESEADLEPGETVLVELRLPESPPRLVEALAEVVGERQPSSGAGRFRIALAFRTISESDREAVVRAVYREELSALRRPGSEGRSA